MQNSWEDITGPPDARALLIGDHASAYVPDEVELGIDPALLETHIAIDLGVAALAKALCDRVGMAGVLGAVSRLVVDLNREEDAPHIVPIASDGHAIPGNAIDHDGRQARIVRYWAPYHDRIAALIAANRPALLVSLHSFTPQLAARPEDARPWQVGVLYNRDDRAARIAIPLLEAAGVCVGDQLPYSGALLNATMNRHGEANGIAYLGLEVRQDQIGDAAGVDRWAGILTPVIMGCLTGLAT